MAHTSMGEYYHLFLEEEKAVDEMLIAYKLNPLSSDTIAILARVSMIAGKYKEAMAYAKEAHKLNKENVTATNVIGYCTGFMGDWNKALKIFQKLYKSLGNFPLALMGLGYSYAQLNKKDETEKIIQQLEDLKKQQPESSIEFILAFLYITIGNLEKFYEYYDV